MSQNKNSLVNKDDILKFIDDFKTEYEVEVPEWESISQGVIVVRPAHLDDHITAMNAQTATNLMMEYYKDCKVKEKEPDPKEVERISELGKSDPKTLFEIEIFAKCVIRPLFSLGEVASISKTFPCVVNRTVKYILSLTTSQLETGRENVSNQTN